MTLRQVPESVHTEDDVLRYISRIGRATRQHPQVDTGVSPRGIQKCFESARARAVLTGRDYVTPDDVKAVVIPVLAHRLVLKPEAVIDTVKKATIIEEIVEEVPVPTVEFS